MVITKWVAERYCSRQVQRQGQVDKLRPGMTRQQVQAIVGTPLLKDMFHANRWDYTYQHYRKHQLIGNAHLTLYFKGEVLERIEGQALPDSTRQDTTPQS